MNRDDTSATAPVRFYWRPGCPFCSTLEFRLRRRGVELEKLNIWQDEEARAFVRSVNRGNETVPTVVVGDTALTNPRPEDVLALLS